jgi:oligopeptide/dipeptide ABC transporter ATP-binding protein
VREGLDVKEHLDARNGMQSLNAVTPPLLEVNNLTTLYGTPDGNAKLKAVDNVSFKLESGHLLAVVGESGSGKTALCRSVMRLFPTAQVRLEGKVLLNGSDILSFDSTELRQVWGLKMAIVFQDPMTSLNPLMRIGNQVSEGLRRRLSVPRRQARERAISLMESVGIPDAGARYRQYPHQLSGGLRQRVAIAIAVACDPDLLILDEPTTGLDVTTQARILNLLAALVRDRGIGAILVTHDIDVAAHVATQMAVMYAGRIVEYGIPATVLDHPMMRYTAALLETSPSIHGQAHARLKTIPGHPPDLSSLGPGCPFAPRCESAIDRCHKERPPLVANGAGLASGPTPKPGPGPNSAPSLDSSLTPSPSSNSVPSPDPDPDPDPGIHLYACWNPNI